MTTQIAPEIKGHWLLGSIMALRENPFAFTKHLATYGDLVQTKVGPFTVYIASSPEVIHDLLIAERENIFKNANDLEVLGRFLGRGLLTNEGESHKQQRKLVQPAFHHRRIQSYAETMVNETQAIIADWYDGLIVDVDQVMMHVTLNIVAKTLFSSTVSPSEAETIARALASIQVDTAKLSAGGFPIPSWLPLPINQRMKQATAAIDRIVWRLIRERRAAGIDTGDLLSMLLLSKDEAGNGMSDQQVRDEVITLMLAGHETTANALTWCIYMLTQHPEIQQTLQAEVDSVVGNRAPTMHDLAQLSYNDKVLKETLRMYPPAWALTPRITKKPMVLGGYQIPAGVAVMPSPYTTHHNPAIWHNPDQFDPERFTPEQEAQRHKYAYIPFGAGNRVCIGNTFATMEMRLVLATLMQHVDFTLEPSQKVEFDPQITLGLKYGLRVRIGRRKP